MRDAKDIIIEGLKQRVAELEHMMSTYKSAAIEHEATKFIYQIRRGTLHKRLIWRAKRIRDLEDRIAYLEQKPTCQVPSV